MNRHEQALVDASPTFADICDRVRTARRAHLAAIAETDRLQELYKAAQRQQAMAGETEELARDALDAFIDKETALD